MNTLAFDIAQFFPLPNYHLLPLILDKAGFNSKIFFFFFNYLIDRQIQYVWNSFISPFFRADIDVDQGLALSPILSALYITLIFYIFKKRTKKSFISHFCFYSFIY